MFFEDSFGIFPCCNIDDGFSRLGTENVFCSREQLVCRFTPREDEQRSKKDQAQLRGRVAHGAILHCEKGE